MGLLYLYSIQNINGCKLVLVEAHYHTILISQHCKVMLVDFMYSRILTFQWYQWGWSVPRLVCCSCMALFKYNAWWHLRATACISLIFDMNCILWFIFYCILLRAFVDWYIDFTNVCAFIMLLASKVFVCFYKKLILRDFSSRRADVQWLNRGFETFFIILSGSLTHFVTLFGFLICL
jgi:hypothetical protein